MAGQPKLAFVFKIWLILCTVSQVTVTFAQQWPNPVYGFTNNDRTGVLSGSDVVDRDYRHYYHLVALELLLVHHGFRNCEAVNWDDEVQLERTRSAVEAFQSNRNLKQDALELDAAFWQQLVIPLRPGEDSPGVLAMHWLVQSTSQASRPPLWDVAEVERHSCRMRFDADVQIGVLSALQGSAEVANASVLNTSGLSSSAWHVLLSREEQRVSSGCLQRSFVARMFGAAMVLVWSIMVVFFAVLHVDGWNNKQGASGNPQETILKSLLRFGQELVPLFAVTASQNLALLGVWSFPSDLLSQLVVGCQFSAGAIVLVRLSANRGRRISEKSFTRYFELTGFAALNVLIYCLFMMVPGLTGLWYAPFLIVMIVFWALVVGLITDQRRRSRAGLFFVLCLLAGIPTLLSLVTRLVGRTGLWFVALTPTYLIVLSTVCERVIGNIIEKSCEYTTETRWLLSFVFRLCIELVRFNSALAILLLSLVTENGFGFLVLHLTQTLIFKVLMSEPHRACLSEEFEETEQLKATPMARELFHAGEIVSYAGNNNVWLYRSQAAMLPLEIVLFLTHLCQLLYLGLPVGASVPSWCGGLALLVAFSATREIMLHLLAMKKKIVLPHMPWSVLPGHLVAFVMGAGMVMSTFAQVSFFWEMYAHHWAACYVGGSSNTGMEATQDSDVVLPVLMSILCLALLLLHVYSFSSWAVWMKEVATARRPAKAALIQATSKVPGGSGNLVRAFTASGLEETLESVHSEHSVHSVHSTSSIHSGPSPGLKRSKSLACLVSGKSGLITPLSPASVSSPKSLRMILASPKEIVKAKEEHVTAKLAGSWNAALNLLQSDGEDDDDSYEHLPGAVHEPQSQQSPDGMLDATASQETEHERLLQEVLMEVAYDDANSEFQATAQTLITSPAAKSMKFGASLGATEEFRDTGFSINDAVVQEIMGEQVLRTTASAEQASPVIHENIDKLLSATLEENQVDGILAALDKQEEEAAREREEAAAAALAAAEEAAAKARAEEEEAERIRLTEAKLQEEKRQEREEAARLEQERLERERLEREQAERLERDRLEKEKMQQQEKERLEFERLEKERMQQEEAARAERERSERERLEREEKERLEQERLAREAEAREQTRRQAAAELLLSSLAERSKEKVESCLQTREQDHIPEKIVQDAFKLLHELEEEEARAAAEHRLQHACSHTDTEELASAISCARQVGVAAAVVTAAEARLEHILAERRRREAASRRLVELLQKPAPGTFGATESVQEQLSSLEEALATAKACGVAEREMQAGQEALKVLQEFRSREEALQAVKDALEKQDVQAVQTAMEGARKCGVAETELIRSEQLLQNLIDAIELADNKERLLARRIENATDAKTKAEKMETSREVQELMEEGGVISTLREAVQDAKKTRMVKKGVIEKADAVLSEIVADMKRILDDKRMQEKRLAQESLKADLELAKSVTIVTADVVQGVQEAIAAAARFNADVREAEQILSKLILEHERVTAEAKDSLEKALADRVPEDIRQGLLMCQQLVLTEELESAMTRLRNIVNEEIGLARGEHDREARLAMVATLEEHLSVLRDNGDKQLRGFHNELQELKGALRVFCRVRPLNGREKKRNDSIAVEIIDPFTVGVDREDHDRQEFSYDAIFGPDSTQSEVFAECKSMVQSVEDGYNVTVFTYGQTGAGKTWTLYGSADQPGLSPRLCEEIFAVVERDRDKLDFEVRASMIELYLADLKDLLSKAKEPAKLEFKGFRHADGTFGQRLEGMIEVPVSCSEDLAQVVSDGLQNRQVRATKMNASSSRSHFMLIITMDVTDKETGRKRSGKISIVDLAGSERVGKSGVQGEAMREAIEINKSLTALGDVMMAFTSKARMIPYRNHKLTQLMQDSLGGSAKTLMFVNISPASSNTDETVNSLKYASRARCIENDVKSSSHGPPTGSRRSTH